MVIVTDKEYYMDGYLKSNLDIAKTAVKDDWDMLFIVDGIEGSGKSVLAMQMAYFCDPSLSLDRITFTPEDFKQAIVNSEKRQAIIFDEAYGGLSSRQAMTKVNKALVQMLAEIRQKNLFVFLVLPCFFELDRYAAIWRSRALIHVYTDGFKRGKFMFFNQDKKKFLWIYGKKTYSYKRPSSDFYGSFTNNYPIGSEEYREKKHQSLFRYVENEDTDTKLIQRDAFLYLLKKQTGFKAKEINFALKNIIPAENMLSTSRINEILAKMTKKEGF